MLLTTFTALGGATYAASTLLPIRGIHDWLVGGAVFRIAPISVALTFDDGPNIEQTPVILDVLAKKDIKATFFLIGQRSVQHPEITRRIANEGHAIGNHTWSHSWLPIRSTRYIENELTSCQNALADITGEAPVLMRPPYGSRDFRMYRVARRLGLTPVLWSHDSHDWAGSSSKHILQRLQRTKDGDIVLCHDGNPRASGIVPALRQWLLQKPNSVRLATLSTSCVPR